MKLGFSLGLLLCLPLLVGTGCASTERADVRAPDSDAGGFALGSTFKVAKQEAARESGFGLDKQVLDPEGRPVTDDEVVTVLKRGAGPDRDAAEESS